MHVAHWPYASPILAESFAEELMRIRKNKSTRRVASHRGFSLLQLVITVGVVGIVTALAVYGIASARQRIRLTNSSRMLASYLEKARVDSVRRHPMTADAMAGVSILDKTRYRVKMDFDQDGTVDTRDFSLDNGVEFATDPISLLFDWRGRLVDLPSTEIKVTIAMQWGTDPSDQRVVDVTRSGDVTIDSDVYLDDVPNVNVTVDELTGLDSGSTVNGNNNPDPTPAPTAQPSQDPTPTPSPTATPTPTPNGNGNGNGNGGNNGNGNSSPTPTPTPIASPTPDGNPNSCLASPSPSSMEIRKNGGSSTVTFTLNQTGDVTFSEGANNLSVTKSGLTFTVTSLNNTRGNFTLTFSTPCGNKTVGVSVIN